MNAAVDPTAATPGVLLEIRDLRTHFFTPEGVVRAVNGVDLTLRRGRTLCVLGESGCGKSITARSVMQLVDRPGRIVGGRILFHDAQAGVVDVAGLSTRGAAIRRYRGKKIALIFQEPMTALSPVHTIGSQIVETIRMHYDVSVREAHARAVAMLRKVGIPNPAERMRAYAFQLSGGMRQRAVIALALCCEPDLLIADEPTTALDVTTQATILDLMRGLQSELGMAMMFITHDLGVVAEIADDVAVMYLGEVVEQGRVEDIFARPRHPYTQALLASVPRLGSRKGQGRLASIRGMVPHPFARPEGCTFHTRCDQRFSPACSRIAPKLLDVGLGQQARCHLYDPALAQVTRAIQATIAPRAEVPTVPLASDILLRVEGLKMHFPIRRGFLRRIVGHVKAVDGVSFDIRAGETLSLVGESGCGKTTTGRAILRIYEPTAGKILYRPNGAEPVDLAVLKRRDMRPYHREIRMIFQDPQSSLNPRLTVFDIVAQPLRLAGIASGRELEDRVAALLRRVSLRPEYLRRYPHAFSGGERQRIGIARALALSPRLVVADEAVSALDVSVQAQTLNLLQDLQDELALTYLFVSHDLSVVAHISDRVAVMYCGQLVEVGRCEDLFARPLHPYTEALLSSGSLPDPGLRRDGRRIRLQGEVADPSNPPPGCPFHPRCRYAMDICGVERPALAPSGLERQVACHRAAELDLAGVST